MGREGSQASQPGCGHSWHFFRETFGLVDKSIASEERYCISDSVV